MNLYLVIKRLCEEHGTTVTRLEKELGFGHRVIARWSESSPSVDNIKKVAQYFGVTVSYLVDYDEDEDKKTFASSYSALTPENQLLIDSLMERLLKSQR